MTWSALIEAAEAVRAEVAARDPRVAGLRLAGIGWATVEHERAIDELDALFAADRRPDADAGPGAANHPWTSIGPDPALGALGWLRQTGIPGAWPVLVVLEPDTEGRLAASLARFGEGVAVVYLGEGRPGPGSLVPGGSAWGPHAVLLGPRAAGER